MRPYPGRDEPTVVCDNCGTRFREVRASCPRCRARRVHPDSEQAPSASGRRHETLLAAAGFVLAAVVTGLMAWPSSPEDASSSQASTLGRASPLAHRAVTRQPEQPEGAGGSREPSGSRAFLDAKGAAALAYSDGRVDDALAHFQKVLAESPDDPEALNNVGQVLVRLGRAAEALPYLERAASRFPDRWDFQFNLARALGEAGRWSEAAECYRTVAARRPDDDATAFNLARALERAGQTSEAIAAYQHAVQLAPGDPSFHLALALAQERAGDLVNAQRAYEEYLALLPEGDEAQRVKAHIETLAAPTPERRAESPPQ